MKRKQSQRNLANRNPLWTLLRIVVILMILISGTKAEDEIKNIPLIGGLAMENELKERLSARTERQFGFGRGGGSRSFKTSEVTRRKVCEMVQNNEGYIVPWSKLPVGTPPRDLSCYDLSDNPTGKIVYLLMAQSIEFINSKPNFHLVDIEGVLGQVRTSFGEVVDQLRSNIEEAVEYIRAFDRDTDFLAFLRARRHFHEMIILDGGHTNSDLGLFLLGREVPLGETSGLTTLLRPSSNSLQTLEAIWKTEISLKRGYRERQEVGRTVYESISTLNLDHYDLTQNPVGKIVWLLQQKLIPSLLFEDDVRISFENLGDRIAQLAGKLKEGNRGEYNEQIDEAASFLGSSLAKIATPEMATLITSYREQRLRFSDDEKGRSKRESDLWRDLIHAVFDRRGNWFELTLEEAKKGDIFAYERKMSVFELHEEGVQQASGELAPSDTYLPREHEPVSEVIVSRRYWQKAMNTMKFGYKEWPLRAAVTSMIERREERYPETASGQNQLYRDECSQLLDRMAPRENIWDLYWIEKKHFYDRYRRGEPANYDERIETVARMAVVPGKNDYIRYFNGPIPERTGLGERRTACLERRFPTDCVYTDEYVQGRPYRAYGGKPMMTFAHAYFGQVSCSAAWEVPASDLPQATQDLIRRVYPEISGEQVLDIVVQYCTNVWNSDSAGKSSSRNTQLKPQYVFNETIGAAAQGADMGCEVHATCHVYRGEQFEQILNENSYVNFHHDASGYPWYAISPDIFNLDHRQIDGEQERLWLYKVDFNRGSALSYVDKQNKSRTRYGIIALLNENNADRFTALGQWRQYMSSKEEVSSALGKMLNIPTWPATVLSDAYRNTGDDSKGEVSIPTDDEIEGYYTSQRVLAPKLRYVLEGIPLLRDFFLDPISEEEPEHGMRPPS